MIDAIIKELSNARLNGKKLFNKVEEAIDLPLAMQSQVKPSPVAYVVEISRRPGNNNRMMGNPMQNVKTEIGIVIGISKINDPQGVKAKAKVMPILKKTRETLFGFIPIKGCSAMLIGAADPIGVTNDALWQLERFSTEQLEEAKNGTS